MSALKTPRLDAQDDVWLGLSSMVDGQASEHEIAACLAMMKQDSDIQKRWSEYFLIGEAMRGIEPIQSDCASRLAARLKDEPTVLAPSRKSWVPRVVVASFATLAVAGLISFSGQFQQAPVAVAKPAQVAVAVAPVVVSGERDTTVKLSKIRKLTGNHMVMSLGVSPHAFSVVEVDYANVDATRSAVKATWKPAEGFSLTYLPFTTRAIVDALGEFPHLNASVADNELVVHNFIDIGVAVDLEFQGLLVPVVRSAETKRLRAIAREINDLATRARSRKLTPDEIQGGTFTISNNGSAGSVLTMAIINQPQVAIMSTDAIVRRPVVATMPNGDEAIVIHPVGNLAMSWDHRAFDGAYAAGFLV